MSEETPRIAAARAALREEYGAGTRRHIFICAESDKGKCCSRKIGSDSWKFLKRRPPRLPFTNVRNPVKGVC